MPWSRVGGLQPCSRELSGVDRRRAELRLRQSHSLRLNDGIGPWSADSTGRNDRADQRCGRVLCCGPHRLRPFYKTARPSHRTALPFYRTGARLASTTFGHRFDVAEAPQSNGNRGRNRQGTLCVSRSAKECCTMNPWQRPMVSARSQSPTKTTGIIDTILPGTVFAVGSIVFVGDSAPVR